MAKRVDPVTPEQKRNAARTTALRRLRELHRADWNRLLKAELEKVGVKWTPPPTEEEKAAQTIRELVSKFPSLRTQALDLGLAAALGVPEVPGTPLEDPDPALPGDPVIGKDGPDPALDVTRNDFA